MDAATLVISFGVISYLNIGSYDFSCAAYACILVELTKVELLAFSIELQGRSS